MALFGKNNQDRAQQQMFEQELQAGREENAVKYSDVGDDVYFAQKEKTEELTKWQQDLRDDIEIIIHDFKREVVDSEGNYKPMLEFIRKDEQGRKHFRRVRPVINDIGINTFRTSVRPSLSRNLIMSNYTEARILLNLKRDVINWIQMVGYHRELYGIEKGDMSMVVLMLKKIIEPSYFRAMNNGERSYLNTINKRVEAITYGNPNQQGQQRKGLLNQLMG